MGKNKWLRSHVERCLQDIWGLCRVEMDADRDYPYRVGTAACWVSVHDFMEPPTVDVFAHAALGVPRSAKLLTEINELNAASGVGTFYWSDGTVAVKHSLLAASVDRKHLRRVCAAVGGAANHVGGLMAQVFDGSTPFPLDAVTADGAPE